jgi:hypothetical protein
LRGFLLGSGLLWQLFAVEALPAQDALDPAELAALLMDLEASGGVLSADDRALLGPPETPTPRRGRGTLAVDWNQDRRRRLTGDLRQQRGAVAGRLRWRQDDMGDRLAGWCRWQQGAWFAAAGSGRWRHGFGILTAPLGARSRLATGASLLPSVSGWRPGVASVDDQVPRGLALGLTTGPVAVAGMLGRDEQGGRQTLVRTAYRTALTTFSALGLRRAGYSGGSLALTWQGGPWRLSGEAAAWRQDRGGAIWQRAWIVAVAHRRPRWQGEVVAAVSQAYEGLPGASRPGCLAGWQATGWAGRLRWRTGARSHLELVAGDTRARDPEVVISADHGRGLLAVAWQGTGPNRLRWDVGWRRLRESWHRWDPDQPWLPAQVAKRRWRSWLVVQVARVLGTTEVSLGWRRLDEQEGTRQLLTCRWQGRGPRWRWRVAGQAAWGAPLDLVAVAAPVSGLVTLQHWGHWRGGWLLGVEHAGALLWRLGLDLRHHETGVLAATGRVAWGWVF